MSLYEDTDPRALKEFFRQIDLLAWHALPPADVSPLLRDDYEGFLTRRRERLWQEITRVTGITSRADIGRGPRDVW